MHIPWTVVRERGYVINHDLFNITALYRLLIQPRSPLTILKLALKNGSATRQRPDTIFDESAQRQCVHPLVAFCRRRILSKRQGSSASHNLLTDRDSTDTCRALKVPVHCHKYFIFLFAFRLLSIPLWRKQGTDRPLNCFEPTGICLASSTVKEDKMRETAWKPGVSEGPMTLSCLKPSLPSFVLLSIF